MNMLLPQSPRESMHTYSWASRQEAEKYMCVQSVFNDGSTSKQPDGRLSATGWECV